MKKNVMLKCFLVTLLSAIIIFVSGILIMFFNGQKMIRERLVSETALAAALLNDSADFENLKDFNGGDEVRITVISLDGEVMFESDTTELMENHLDREEVQSAIEGIPKTVERYSSTFSCRMTYYALKTEISDGTQVVIRLAVKSSRISSYLLTALPFLLLSLAVSLLVAALFADKISKNISGKINEVSKSLKSLNEGAYIPLKVNMNEPEFYSLFNEINELNEMTEKHIKQVESEHIKLTNVLENVAQGILALNSKEEIVFVNGSALKIFNSNADYLGKKIYYLIEDKKLLNKIEETAKNGGGDFEYEYKNYFYYVNLKIISDEKSTELKTIIIFTDITEERLVAKQKSEFFANASHELKTPLTVMQGLSELLLEKNELDESSKKQIERINKESIRLNTLILDMLKLSNLERTENEINSVAVNLEETANEVVFELMHEINAKHLSVDIKGKATVLADPKKMYELVNNIIGNAVSYNKEKGSVKVNITEDEKKVVFEVEDTGIGIEKEHIPRLCERFYRVDKSRSKKTGGTGLGLAIVKHICALYKAELKIESEIQKGTKVTVVFNK